VPELFYLDGGLVDVPRENAPMKVGTGVLAQMMNVWSAEVIQRSLYERGMSSRYYLPRSLISFYRLLVGLPEALGLHPRTCSRHPCSTYPTPVPHAA
jgi:hypothetical protein